MAALSAVQVGLDLQVVASCGLLGNRTVPTAFLLQCFSSIHCERGVAR